MTGRVLLAAPRSFCAGVDRAIEIVERLLEQHGAPVYVMPSSSGLNAHSSVADLADHLRAAMKLSRRRGSRGP